MSRIEQLIGEIEEYIDSCKFQPLSNTKILVNKEELEDAVFQSRIATSAIPEQAPPPARLLRNRPSGTARRI